MLEDQVLQMFREVSSQTQIPTLYYNLGIRSINDAADREGNTVLFYACKIDQEKNHNFSFLDCFLRFEDVQLSVKNRNKETVFCRATKPQKIKLINAAITRAALAKKRGDPNYLQEFDAVTKSEKISSTRIYMVRNCNPPIIAAAKTAGIPPINLEINYAAWGNIDNLICLLDEHAPAYEEKGASHYVNFVFSNTGEAALHSLMFEKKNVPVKKIEDAIKLLLAYGAEPLRDKNGFTALTRAYKHGMNAAINLLLSDENPLLQEYIKAQFLPLSLSKDWLSWDDLSKVIRDSSYQQLIASLPCWINYFYHQKETTAILKYLASANQYEFIICLLECDIIKISQQNILTLLDNIKKFNKVTSNPTSCIEACLKVMNAHKNDTAQELLHYAYKTNDYYLAKVIIATFLSVSYEPRALIIKNKFFANDLEFLLTNKSFNLVCLLLSKEPTLEITDVAFDLIIKYKTHITNSLIKLFHSQEKVSKIICCIVENESSRLHTAYITNRNDGKTTATKQLQKVQSCYQYALNRLSLETKLRSPALEEEKFLDELPNYFYEDENYSAVSAPSENPSPAQDIPELEIIMPADIKQEPNKKQHTHFTNLAFLCGDWNNTNKQDLPEILYEDKSDSEDSLAQIKC